MQGAPVKTDSSSFNLAQIPTAERNRIFDEFLEKKVPLSRDIELKAVPFRHVMHD